MRDVKIETLVEEHGEPVMRFLVQEEMDVKIAGDWPDECAVFLVGVPSRVMVVSRYGVKWYRNYAERAVVWELLRQKLEKGVNCDSV